MEPHFRTALHVKIQITADFCEMCLELWSTDQKSPAESDHPVIFEAEDAAGVKTASLRCCVTPF